MEQNNEKEPLSLDIDLSYLRTIAGDSAEFMIEMIDLFLDQTPGYFDQLQLAVDEGNWKAVADTAHKIKPTLAFVGVNTAKQEIESIEKKARSLENVDEIPSQLRTLRAACSNLYENLRKVRAELESEL